MKPFQGLTAPVPHNGGLKGLFKLLICEQKAGHEKIKDAPQLSQMVFHGSSRQGKPGPGTDGFYGPGRLGRRIFDVLGLVDDLVAEIHGPVKGQVPLQQIVGGNDNVRSPILFRRKPFKKLLPLSLASGCGGHRKLRRKPDDLVFPVIDQGGRTYDQGPSAALSFFIQEQGDDLDRLSQPHFIGQDPAEAISVQALQPPVPRFLVAPQYSGKRLRYLKFTVLHVLHAPDHCLKKLVTVKAHAPVLLEHSVQEHGAVHGKADRRRSCQLLFHSQASGQPGYRQKAVISQSQEISVFHPVKLLPGVILCQDGT